MLHEGVGVSRIFSSQVLPTKLTDPIQLTNYFSEMKVFVTSRSHLAILLLRISRLLPKTDAYLSCVINPNFIRCHEQSSYDQQTKIFTIAFVEMQ